MASIIMTGRQSKASATPGEAEPPRSLPAPRLAPLWHTGALVALIVAVSTTGLLLAHARPSGAPPVPSPPGWRLASYVAVLVVNAALVVYVAFVGRDRGALRQLLGPHWLRPDRVARDLASALLAFAAIEAFALFVARVVGVTARTGSAALLPASAFERAAWVAVAVSVGVGEEIVYRGYLQRQLGALVRSDAAGVLLQAVLFALAHADQGSRAAEIGVDGLLLGFVALRSGSLLPGMIAHVAIDLLSGMAG